MADTTGPTRRTVIGRALAISGLAGTGLLTARPGGAAAAPAQNPRQAATDTEASVILVQIPNIRVMPVPIAGYDDGTWFVADSFSFGVERELKKAGEKGGTEDINIGIGELQECTISKSMDWASPVLAQFAINGNSPGGARIHFLASGGDGETTAYLKYKLDRCFVKSWSTSGDADDQPTEEVAFYYNKIAFGVIGGSTLMGWDNTKHVPWRDHGIVI